MAGGDGRPPVGAWSPSGADGKMTDEKFMGYGLSRQRIEPTSIRGKRTLTALVEAARKVFERDGYVEARIIDISTAAGVAVGSFYTYFDSKEDIFAAVVEAVQEDMLHPHLMDHGRHESVAALINAANTEYLLAYKANARLMSVFEQVVQVDESFRDLRRRRGRAFGQRSARLIRRLQEEGRADPTLDPLISAFALNAMVGRMAYQVFVLGEEVVFEDLVRTLDRLWINALHIDEQPEGVPQESRRRTNARGSRSGSVASTQSG